MKKILPVLFAFVVAVSPAAAVRADDLEERTFLFYRALSASILAAAGRGREAAEMFAEVARHRHRPEFARAAVEAAEDAQAFALAARYADEWGELGGGAQAEERAAANLIRAGNIAAAEPRLRGLLSQNILSAEGLHNHLSAAGDPEAAADAGRRLFGDDSESQHHYGRLAARAGRMDEARAAFTRAAETATGPDPHFALALLSENKSGPAAGVVAVDEYLKRGCPGAVAAACREAFVLLAYRRFSRGAQNWRDALQDPQPLAAEAAAVAGAALEQSGLFARAVAQYAQTPPGEFYFRARLGMARIVRDDGDLSGALKILDDTPTGGRDEFIRREVTAADILKRRDGSAAALARIAEARKIAPNDGGLLYRQSLYAEEAGDVSLALELLEKMTMLFPDDPDGWNALGYVLADHNLRLPEARAHITRALRMKPDDPNILDSLGWVHYRMGELSLARRQLQEALEKSGLPGSAEIAAHLGEVLWELGEYENAREVWRRALDGDGENRVLLETLGRYRPF